MYNFILSFIILIGTVTAVNDFAVSRIANLTNFQAENLAVRKNGHVLVTTSAPEATLWQIDTTANHTAVIAVKFPGVSGSYGITELLQDVFYVTTGNFSIQTRQPVPESFQLFEVNMTGYRQLPSGEIVSPPEFREVTTFKEAILLNGLTHVDGQLGYVLAADSYAGVVWKADVFTGDVTIAINDTSMDPTPNKAAGINGLKYQDGYLYYTNTGTNIFYRIPIFSNATASGHSEVIANVTKGDDLILDSQNNAFICQQINVLSRVALNGTEQVIAGTADSNTSSLLGPTAAAWGRLPGDQNSLYITTNGGQLGQGVVGSQALSRIDLGSLTSPSSPSSSGTSPPLSTQTGGATIGYPISTSYGLIYALLFVLFIM